MQEYECIKWSSLQPYTAMGLRSSSFFESGSTVGAGAFGKVMGVKYRGRHTEVPEDLVKKTPNPSNSDALAALENELVVLQALTVNNNNNLGIVDFIGYLEDSNSRPAALLFARYEKNLHAAVESMDITIDKFSLKRRMAYQLIRGLRTIHNLGYLHNDIKCKNILVSITGTYNMDVPKAVISDVGIASRDIIPGRGTLLWMIEVQNISGKKRYSSDSYALGNVLIELFGGSCLERRREAGAQLQDPGGADQCCQPLLFAMAKPRKQPWPLNNNTKDDDNMIALENHLLHHHMVEKCCIL